MSARRWVPSRSRPMWLAVLAATVVIVIAPSTAVVQPAAAGPTLTAPAVADGPRTSSSVFHPSPISQRPSDSAAPASVPSPPPGSTIPAVTSPGPEGPAAARGSAARTRYTGRIVVKASGTGAEESELRRKAQDVGLQVALSRRTATGAAVLTVAGDAVAAAALLTGRPGIEYAVAERRMSVTADPNDPMYPSQWDLPAIKVPDAWPYTTGAGTTVAVIDTGAMAHPDIASRYLPGYDFVSDATYSLDGDGRDADPSDVGDWAPYGACDDLVARDSSWHGLHVAGTVAAVRDNGLAVAGMAPGARVLPVRALARCGGTDTDIADAMVWAAGGSVPGVPANSNPARVINLSLGGVGRCTPIEQSAIDAATARGALVVVAAGNDGSDVANYTPANCRGVLVVGATGRTGAPASYSNYGSAITLSAPGTGIWSLGNSGTRSPAPTGWGVASRSGTSMAAPHVSALAALVWSVAPTLTAAQVRSVLTSTVVPFAAGVSGYGVGIIDARAAVDSVRPKDVAAPTIASIDPVGAASRGGDLVTVTGTGLSSATVQIAGRAAQVVSSSETTLVVRAPASTVGRTTLTVTTRGGTASVPFFYDVRPVISRNGVQLFPRP